MSRFSFVANDDTFGSSGARTSATHKEKLNVTPSGDEHNDLFNFVKRYIVNRIYNKILDRDWFSARLFVT